MKKEQATRRQFIKNSVNSAAGAAVLSALAPQNAKSSGGRASAAKIRFSVIGINHGHIYSQIETVMRGGGEMVAFYAVEPDLIAAFRKRFPQVRLARGENEILDDPSIQLILSAAIPNLRAPLGIRVMQHGKDFMTDKPGATSLEQLAEVRRIQAATKRIYSIMYGERLENRATVKAGEMVKSGAIGQVVQTIGLGPHRLNLQQRPAWFFERERYGGIICDIGSHQFDQFLYFTNSTRAGIVASQVGNVHHPQYSELEDFGDVLLRGDGGAGYIRVDWFTPDGLSTWGDARLTILGTDGYIEIRKNVDIASRPGGNHLFLVDQKETRYIDCSLEPLPYGEHLVKDVLNRTETAMNQAHCFLATELALQAQKQAQRFTRSVAPA